MKKKTIAAVLAAALTFHGLGITTDGLAAGYNKVSDGIYQMLDGTAITGILARGIDISHWQGSVDWGQVAADDISFAMLGTRYKGEIDPYFREFAAGAQAHGIKIGAYIYSYATDVAGAEAEADFILDLIKDYPISYPVAYDLEDNSQAGLSSQELAAMVNAFCARIEAAGYYPMLYANDYWLANRIDMSQIKYDVWVARYEVKHAYSNPAMWQATSTGIVNGVTGGVDIDFQYKDFSGKIAPNLWRTIGDKTYYYQNYTMQKNAWIHDGSGWFYMNSGGQPSTGWLTQNGTDYYLTEATGRMADGWLQMADGWHYFNGSGAMQTGWVSDGAAWYYLSNGGVMQTGWLPDGQNRYYLRDSGAMAIGWRQLDGIWYYFNGSGAMQTGWVGDDRAWYYLNPATGAMFTNTEITVDQVLYQVDANGVCHAVVPAEPETGEAAADPGANSDASSNTNETAAADSQPLENHGIVAIVPPID